MQLEFSAIVDAVLCICAEGTIVQFSIILHLAIRHSENDLREAIVTKPESEPVAVGYISVEGTQLPSLT